MDRYSIDGHKLLYHVPRVHEWLQGEIITPIYMEIGPAGACNHRCVFCALDFMRHRPVTLETDLLKTRLAEMGRLGLKSIMFAGEGEPLLHKDIGDLVVATHKAAIDVAITTNGVLLTPELTRRILPHVEWIKISLDAGSAETYARLHGTRPDDFGKVLENVRYAAQYRKARKLSCALGLQVLLLPENEGEVVSLARRAAAMGVDYLVVKPYSQHPKSRTRRYAQVRYADPEGLAKKLSRYNTATFNVVVRVNTMKQWDRQEHKYCRCQAAPFWSYLDADGNVWSCPVYLGDARFLCGNIYRDTMRTIWHGAKRRASLKMIAERLDAGRCRINCRMEQVNNYLWALKHPPQHVNFI